MAAPTIESSTNISEASTSNFNVTLPTDTAADDLLVAIIAKDDDQPMASGSGMTTAFGIIQSTGNSAWAFWKIATATDVSNDYVNFTGDSEGYVGRLYRITGHNPDNPVFTADETGAIGTSTSPQAPSITTVIDTLVFAVTGMDDNDVPYSLDTGTWTEDLNTSVATAGIVIGRKAFSSAGATGVVDFTTNASDGWAASQIAINANIPPVVILETADETAFGADTTPTLEFTGTDTQDEDIEYHIQIDTVNTFDGQTADTPELIDSYSDGTTDLAYQSYIIFGQSFVTSEDVILTSVKFYLKIGAGSPTGLAYGRIYAHDGEFGVSSTGLGSSGDSLAVSGLLDTSTLTGSYVQYTLTFSGENQITLEKDTPYILAFYDSTSATDYIHIQADNSGTHEGNMCTYSGAGWTAFGNYDLNFELYGKPKAPLLDKLSVTPDATFTNTTDGGDTHPFDSGDKCDYTVQAGDALSTDTYYWRVKGIDPAGNNVYSSWAATRSFTIATGEVETNTEINIADAWKDVSKVEVNIGDVWKEASKVEVNIGDAWKTVF